MRAALPRRSPAAVTGAALVVAWLVASPAAAQVGAVPACPDSGIAIVSVDSLGAEVRRTIASPVDTVYEIAVDRRRWTWTERRAGVAAGVAGTQPASWHACAGAWVSFDRATVVVENARGRVRVRASLEPLLAALRRHAPPPRENPGRENR